MARTIQNDTTLRHELAIAYRRYVDRELAKGRTADDIGTFEQLILEVLRVGARMTGQADKFEGLAAPERP